MAGPLDALVAEVDRYLPVACLYEALKKGQLPGKQCFLGLLSKGLGYAIILGSVVLKLPQILLILRKRSTKGLSTTSFEVETAGFTIALAYCLTKKLPFSAFGELVFMLIQNIIIVLLCYKYSPKLPSSTYIKTAIYAAIAPPFLMGMVKESVIDVLFAGQHAIFLAARIPQIVSNYQNKSTGQLSLATCFLTWAGCVARTFTSLQEKAPFGSILACSYSFLHVACGQLLICFHVILSRFSIALWLNCVLMKARCLLELCFVSVDCKVLTGDCQLVACS